MEIESPEPTKYPILYANTNYQKTALEIEQKISLYRLRNLEYTIETGLIKINLTGDFFEKTSYQTQPL